MNIRHSLSIAAVAALLVSATAGAAQARPSDTDRDGMPDRFERSQGLNPNRAADAKIDVDRDGLSNLREYRAKTLIRDEDTDNDGADDGDEVRDGFASTKATDADSDNDGIRDGDEDADRDGIDNEDEDDAREKCARDDDDRDRDFVADEDENELGLKVGSRDSDADGVTDGNEDGDRDGDANEDDDDADADACDGDRDDDGESDEDESDLLGTITSFEASTGVLTVATSNGVVVVGTITGDTEIDFEESDGNQDDSDEFEDREATVADLNPGVRVAELDFGDDSVGGTLEEVEIYQM